MNNSIPQDNSKLDPKDHAKLIFRLEIRNYPDGWHLEWIDNLEGNRYLLETSLSYSFIEEEFKRTRFRLGEASNAMFNETTRYLGLTDVLEVSAYQKMVQQNKQYVTYFTPKEEFLVSLYTFKGED